MIQNLSRDQQGQVVGSHGCSRSFAIHGGVRQGCVLSPRLFCSALEMSMANWPDEMEQLGLDLRDGITITLPPPHLKIVSCNFHCAKIPASDNFENVAYIYHISIILILIDEHQHQHPQPKNVILQFKVCLQKRHPPFGF